MKIVITDNVTGDNQESFFVTKKVYDKIMMLSTLPEWQVYNVEVENEKRGETDFETLSVFIETLGSGLFDNYNIFNYLAK